MPVHLTPTGGHQRCLARNRDSWSAAGASQRSVGTGICDGTHYLRVYHAGCSKLEGYFVAKHLLTKIRDGLPLRSLNHICLSVFRWSGCTCLAATRWRMPTNAQHAL